MKCRRIMRHFIRVYTVFQDKKDHQRNNYNFIWKLYHVTPRYTVKPVISGHSKRKPKLVFKNDYCSMQVKSIAECSKGSIVLEHSAILSTFIKLPFVIKTFVLSFFEWPLKTGFTVCNGPCKVYCIKPEGRIH